MKVLVACEYSGIVRDAFTKKGHDATSCDILPTESEGKHYQGDVLDILDDGWDLMIAHPPCQYLTNAGVRWFNEERYGDKARERKKLRLEAFDFFMKLINAPIDKIAVENPVGWVNGHYRKPNQIIHPYYFGDPENKRTCLWLKNLPNLEPTNMVEPKIYAYFKSGAKKGKPIYWCDYQGRRHDNERWKIRSTTFQGIADAMAEQWGEVE
jgi:hypothetical protein